MSRFNPVNLEKNCRVYFIFADRDGKQVTTYYDRSQMVPDEMINNEAMKNAKDMQNKMNFKILKTIYVARTKEQISKIESKL